MQKPDRLVDPDGRVYALVQVSQTPRGERFFMGFAEAFEYLAHNPLPVRYRRVFDYLFSVLETDNFLHVKQADIAKKLGMDHSDVSKALKHLVEIGLIDGGPKIGCSNTYRMSPHVAWRGKAVARVSALHEAQKRWGMAKA